MLKSAWRLFWVSLIALAAACAPARTVVVAPSMEGRDLGEYLVDRGRIAGIDARFGILFERNEAEIRGDAAISMARNGDLSLRVYSLGFLALELTSGEGVTKSTPHLDGDKKLILTRGLRDCIFWWDMPDYVLADEGDRYSLDSGMRQIWIDKRTFLPLRQRIWFDDGRELIVTYGEPQESEGVWYPSKIRIELLSYAVTLSISEMEFRR